MAIKIKVTFDNTNAIKLDKLVSYFQKSAIFIYLISVSTLNGISYVIKKSYTLG